MRRLGLGAIAIVDVLGFKGIWTREDPKAVVAHLLALRRRGMRLQGRDRSGVLVYDSGLRHRVRCMSDTIVVIVALKGRRAPARGLYRAMFSATLITGQIVLSGLLGTPPFLFRGCIAVGELEEQADFLIGPAVDEAAERFELADGPFLWLAPSALTIAKRYADTYIERLVPALMLPHSVPLNDGRLAKTQAFAYFGITRSRDERKALTQRLLASFGAEPLRSDVKIKKRNAAKFLAHIERFVTSGRATRDRPVPRLLSCFS